jgi:AraC-like DNA-binding protein
MGSAALAGRCMQLDFDLSLVPARERFEFWYDVGSRVHRPIRSRYEDPSAQLSVRALIRGSGELIIGRMEASEQYFERTETLIRKDLVDTFQLILLNHGSARWTAQGNHFHAQSGDLFLLDNHDISQSEWSTHQQIYALLPRELLAGQGSKEPAMRVLRSKSTCAIILRQYLAALWERLQSEAAEDREKLSHGLAGLIRIYFGGLDVLPDSEVEMQQESLTDAIKRWLGGQLQNPDLGPEQICSAFHLSRSSLYALFKAEGGIRTYLQACRLARARRLLERPEGSFSINDVARELGFRSLSSFSRAFRDHWGVTARSIRQQALAAAQTTPKDHTQASMHLLSQAQLKENVEDYYKNISAMSSQTPLP